jgi:hypothetical protein
MKRRSLVSILILVLIVLILVGSGTNEKKAYVATDEEELYGTWINPDILVQKKIIYPDGKDETFYSKSAVNPFVTGQITIVKKWIDRKGDVYYHCTWSSNVEPSTQYWLVRISDSGNAMETVSSPIDFPKKVDPNDLDYGIRYRQ